MPLFRSKSSLVLLQYPNDLFFRELATLHRSFKETDSNFQTGIVSARTPVPTKKGK